MDEALLPANLLALGLIAASASTWIVLGRRIRAGNRIQVNPQPRAAIRPLTVGASLFGYLFAAAAFVGLLKDKVDHDLEVVIISCAAHAFTLVALMALVTRDGSFRQLGITFEGLGKQIQTGTLAFVLTVVPFAAAAMTLVQWLRTDENYHELLKLLHDNPTPESLFIIVLAAGILPPMAEELIFRVILQGALQRVLKPQQAIVIVAVLFSAVHGTPDMFGVFPLALILGFTYFVTHRYWTVVIAHMLFNMANIAILFLSVPDIVSAN